LFSQGQILLTYRTGKITAILLDSCTVLCCFCFKQSIPEQIKSIASHPTFGDVIYSQQITFDVFCCKGLGWAKAGGIGRQPTKFSQEFVDSVFLWVLFVGELVVNKSQKIKFTLKKLVGSKMSQNPQKITKYSWVFVIFCGVFFVGCRP
jgi:hypothetical protein